MFDHGGLSVAVGHVCIQKGSKKLGCDDSIDGGICSFCDTVLQNHIHTLVNWSVIETGDVVALLAALELIVYQGGDLTGSNATAIYMQLNAATDAA